MLIKIALQGTWAFQSARLLMDPLKLNELSDDLESFVHVVTWLALRFHKHQDTPPQCLLPATPQDTLRAVNRTNSPLSSLKWMMFDVDARQGKYFIGGHMKSLAIQGGSPQIRLAPTPDGDPTPLARLITVLYGLLQEHYRAIGATGAGSSTPTPISRAPDTYEAGFVKVTTLDEPGLGESEVTSTPISVPPARRVLDDHRAILRAFKQATVDLKGKNTKDVKTADQFLGLLTIVEVRPTGPSGGRKLNMASSTTFAHGTTGASHRESRALDNSASRKRKTDSATGTPSSSHHECQPPDDNTRCKRRKADSD